MKIKYVPIKLEKDIHDKLFQISNKIGCSVSALGGTLLSTVGIILLDKNSRMEFSYIAEKNSDNLMCKIIAKEPFEYSNPAKLAYAHLNIGLTPKDYAICKQLVDFFAFRGNATVFKYLFAWICNLTNEQMSMYRKELLYFDRRNFCSSEDQFFHQRFDIIWEASYELGAELFARATGEYLYANQLQAIPYPSNSK